ncbi:hypothetical protein ACFX2H_008354 [Malus domestica]
MVWGSIGCFFVRCFRVGIRGWDWAGHGLLAMEDLMSKFAARLAVTEAENEIIVVDKRETLTLKSSRVFLVGKVLSSKLVNKEGFKRHMRNLWRPKANVVVTDLEDNRFAFGFNSIHERKTILSEGPWLYNKQYLLVLGEADKLAHLARIPLFFQEFWVQFKGLPLCYMTRSMGKFLGNILGEYVITDQSRKEEQFGSILHVRVRMDVRQPLRRFLIVHLEGSVVKIDARYAKLPLTCFLCGMMDHVEEQCKCYDGTQLDDRVKPYGRWFQDDVFEKDYIRPKGRRFGLDAERGWVMTVPQAEDLDDHVDDVGISHTAKGANEHGGIDIPDMNVVLVDQECEVGGPLLSALPMATTGFKSDYMDGLVDGVEGDRPQPMVLYGNESTPRIGKEEVAMVAAEEYAGSLQLTLLGIKFSEQVSIGGHGGGSVSVHSTSSGPFNLDPFIFGPGSIGCNHANGKGKGGKK